MGYAEYISLLYERIPDYIYEGSLSIFILLTVLILSLVGIRKGWRKITALLLIEYIILLYSSTVIFRKTGETTIVKPTNIERYKGIIEGEFFFDYEMILNILAFVPIGFLLCLAFKSMKWWQTYMIGCCMSVSIELLQYALKRGTTEFGDVLHNTLGCLIGYGIYKLTQIVRIKIIKFINTTI